MSEASASEPEVNVESEVVIEALSREDGMNSTVTVYRDRIEWVKQESISSMPRGKDDPPLIPLDTIMSVKARKDGPLFSKVLLARRGLPTIIFRMISPEAVQMRDAINGLLGVRTAPGDAASD